MKSAPSKVFIGIGIIALVMALLSAVIAITGIAAVNADFSATFFRLCSTQNPQECTQFTWVQLACFGVASLIIAILLLLSGIKTQGSRSGA